MKVVFVDIDGVLNHEQWFLTEECQTIHREDEDDYSRWFSPVSMQRLNTILEKTDAKVVVSSSWRAGRSIEDLQKMFDDNGFKGQIVGITPKLKFAKNDWTTNSVPRGAEIQCWLDAAKEKVDLHIDDYVILDDDRDMLYEQTPHFIPIDPFVGISSADVKLAIQILS